MKTWMLAAGVGTCVIAGGCTTTSSAPTISFTSPVASGPANGASYRFRDQPITLTIDNAARTAPAAATYAFEVATDAAFANKVFTRTGIPERSGATSVTLSTLAAATGNVTYYWRSIATVDDVASQPSATRTLVIQQQIVIGTPSPSEPSSGATTVEIRPQFVARNAPRQGAAGPITYNFQVSRSSDFSSLLFDVNVAEQPGGQTAWTPASDLPAGTIYWRVRAQDLSNSEGSGFTAPFSLVVELFDPRQATFWNNPPGIATWPETAKITSIDFSTGYMLVEFDRRTGPNRWPETPNPDFGPIQYTLGMCFRIDGRWHCSAPTRFWIGRDLEASGRPGEIPNTWFYDSRWGPMTGHRPAPGELVAFWVGQGNLREGTIATNQERSNFVLVRFGENYRAN